MNIEYLPCYKYLMSSNYRYLNEYHKKKHLIKAQFLTIRSR